MTGNGGFCVLLAALFLAPAAARAAVFQFEVLGSSDEWIAIRENIPAQASDTAACKYPGLEPSEQVGVTVHFVRLSAEAKRGRLMPLDTTGSSSLLYTRSASGEGCTSTAEGERRWREIVVRAKSLGIGLTSPAPPAAVVLGEPMAAKACVAIGAGAADKSPCRRVFNQALKKGAVQIGVFLTAVPEAPDGRSCQFVGHRFGAVIQVAGLDFGSMESGVAPGGFINHYDCRSQQFDPLRLYMLNPFIVMLGSFRGTNMADREEHPFLVVFPARSAL